jgi:hypothetical protein
VDPLDYRHPIVAPFRGNERAGLLTTPISRYYRLEVSDDPSGVEVAATIGRGDPLIVTAPLGNGCTVLVATDGSLTSVDPAGVEPWTIWPTWPSFLPIVRELLAYVLSQNQQEWQHAVGTVLSGPVTPDHGANLKMRRPDGTAAPVALHRPHGESQWSFRETELSGIYSLAGQDDASQQFALNVDSRESDLTRIDSQQLPQEFVVRSSPAPVGDEATTSLVAHDSWSGPLLWFALLLLFIESVLAWRFGRGAA